MAGKAEVAVRFSQRLFERKTSSPADDLIAWLEDKNVDDRRFISGTLFGGPHSLRVLKWVLTRPDSDKGTAAMLLWEFGMPYSLIKDGNRPPLLRQVQQELVEMILGRWRSGLFVEAIFEFDPRENAKVYRRELKKKGLKGTDPLHLPEEMWQPIKGRRPVYNEATAVTLHSSIGAILEQLRLADLAAIDPVQWEPIRRRSLGLD
jgi:hypothetical protein